MLDWKKEKLGTTEHEEIANIMFEIARNTGEIGKREESLKIYQEVYGTFFYIRKKKFINKKK